MSELHASSSVFLSYSHTDNEFATRLKADLQAQGIAVWIDHEGIQPGTPDWEEALREAIRSASAVVLIASPSARTSRYVKDELRIAEMYQRPVYPLWATGTRWMDVVPIGWGGTQYIDARDRYETALAELATVLRTLSPTPIAAPLTPSTLPVLNFEPRNPYKGLRPFTGADARDFFGREALVHALLEKIKVALVAEAQDAQGARLLAVVGPSGSGKSSVVMAGLLPSLQQNALSDSSDWIYLPPFVPGAHPLEALTLLLAEVFPERSLKSLREDLDDDASRGLHLLATALVKRQKTRVALVVDQFEELFTQTASEHEREHFIDLLMTALTEPQGPVIVILTLRADFYDRPMRYPLLYQHLQERLVAVLPMTLSELRTAIENPAALPDVQLTFEASLVGDMLFDIQGQPGMLPLLQFTLAQLFERRNGLLLPLQAYHDMGGVKGALAKHAESTYTSLPTDEHRRMARALFLRLIDPGTTEQDMTRHRAALSELKLSDTQQQTSMDTVESTFITARLLTTNTVAGIPTIEISHEALMGVWSRLATWVREAYEDMRLQKALSEDVAEWKRRGEPADRLYRGSQLTEAQAWRERNLPSCDEDTFLRASATAEQEALAQAKQQQTRYTRRTMLVGAAGLGLAGLASGYFLLRSPRQVINQLATLPYNYQSQNTYPGQVAAMYTVAWSPDGKRLALGGTDQIVQMCDASTGARLFTYKSPIYAVRAIAWSPDGKRLASAGNDAMVHVWDATNGNPLFTYQGDSYNVDAVAWSPDGGRLASAGSVSGTVQVRDATNGAHLFTYNIGLLGGVGTVAWSPDGKRLASAGAVNGTVQVWDASNGTSLLFVYNGHADQVKDLAWSPDGRRVASAAADETIQIWDANNGTRLFTYKGHTDRVFAVAWSLDGKRLASGSEDKTIQIWDANNGTRLFTYKGHTDWVFAVAWSPDGKWLASAGQDTTVQVWDASNGNPLFTYTDHHLGGCTVAWSPDSKRLAAVNGGTVQERSIASGNLLFVYKNFATVVNAVAWSPDGKWLAMGGDLIAQVLNANDGAVLAINMSHNGGVNAIAWSPDSQRLASASYDKTVQVWKPNPDNIVVKNPLFTYRGHTDLVNAVAWSRDGKWLASAGNDATVQVWDATNGRHLFTYKGHTDWVNAVEWSRDGKWLASASADRSMQVWNPTNGTNLFTCKGHTGQVNAVAWSPDGQWLASASDDTTVQIWDASTGNHRFTYKGHTKLVYAVVWSPDGKWLASAGDDQVVRVWQWQQQ